MNMRLYSAIFEKTLKGDHVLVLCAGMTPEQAMHDAVGLFDDTERDTLTSIGIFEGAMMNVKSVQARSRRMMTASTADARALDRINAMPMMNDWTATSGNSYVARIEPPDDMQAFMSVHTLEITQSLGSWWLCDSQIKGERDFLLLEHAIAAANESMEQTHDDIRAYAVQQAEQSAPEFA